MVWKRQFFDHPTRSDNTDANSPSSFSHIDSYLGFISYNLGVLTSNSH